MRILVVLMAAGLAGGCGGPNQSSRMARESTDGAAEEAAPNGWIGGAVFRKQAAPAAGGKPVPVAAEEPVSRKIVYTAHLDVIVKDFEPARAEVVKLIDAHKGYVSQSDLASNTGSRRTGKWTIRVPADEFPKLLDALVALGVPTRNATDSKDVTEEFVDVTARVKNLKAEEETLNKLLKDATGKLDDLLKIRSQIVQIRGDIERAEGRMRYLANVSALATVNLTLQEIQDYVPPSAPSFGGRVGAAFSASVKALQEFGEAVVIFAVSIAVWLPFIALGVWLFVRFVKWTQRQTADRKK